ncbi:COG3427 Carbon monoxide dehydrogenase subunit G, CoxG [Burkholderiaceae bacterium]|jgi:carbon monoxide dehydrogenase subunit G
MRFEGEFRVPGQPLAVLERFAEVERMVKCMPGASIDGRDDDGNYLGGMLVAFGPKKIKFKGKVTASVDFESLTGKLHVRGAADMRAGARAEVNVVYTVRDDASASKPTSIVALTSDAELGGVLADFGSTGGIAVTQALMDVFAQRCAEEFSKEASVPTSEGSPQPSTAATASESATSANTAGQGSAATAAARPAPEPTNEALSANTLLWSIIRTKFKQFKKWLGLRS